MIGCAHLVAWRPFRRERFYVPPLLQDFDLLTLAEVAQLLHCSKAHVCNAVAGRIRGCSPIPSVSLGRRKLVRRESLLLWIERNEEGGAMIPVSPERGRKNA